MNKAGKLIVFIFALFLICNGTEAQVLNRSVVHTISFSPQFFQIKPSANYGLVHRGLNLEMAFQRIKETDASHLSYEGSFAFGLNYNRGIGLTWHLTPID